MPMAEGLFVCLFTHVLRISGLNLCRAQHLYVMKSVTFLSQILTKPSLPVTISQRHLVDLNKAFKALCGLSPSYFEYDVFQIFYCALLLQSVRSCPPSCVESTASSSPEPKYSLHLSCSVTCPQVTSYPGITFFSEMPWHLPSVSVLLYYCIIVLSLALFYNF